MTGQNAGSVWPPSPQTGEVRVVRIGKTPITPQSARNFYLGKCIAYGPGFGAAYGGAAGFPYMIIGAFFGAPIGAFLGFVLGIFNGFTLGSAAWQLARSGHSVSTIAKMVKCAAPLSTVIGGTCLLLLYGHWTGDHVDPFKNQFVQMMYLISTFASWHAACMLGQKFVTEYE